jgi:hypothetical protein
MRIGRRGKSLMWIATASEKRKRTIQFTYSETKYRHLFNSLFFQFHLDLLFSVIDDHSSIKPFISLEFPFRHAYMTDS